VTPGEILAARARALAIVPDPQAAHAGRRMIVATIGAQDYGFPLARVHRIVPLGRITRLPHAPPLVAGLASLAGILGLVFDARVWRELPPSALGPKLPVLMIGPASRPLALVVDAVLRYADVPTDLPAPGPAGSWLVGLTTERVLVVDDEVLAADPAFSLALGES
jgi:purine-binding chemotaxis protein CheW